MVFGLSRQEDLIAYILAETPEGERSAIVTELQIDLSPQSGPGTAPWLNYLVSQFTPASLSPAGM